MANTTKMNNSAASAGDQTSPSEPPCEELQAQLEKPETLSEKKQETIKDLCSLANNAINQIEDLNVLFAATKKEIEHILSVTKAYEATFYLCAVALTAAAIIFVFMSLGINTIAFVAAAIIVLLGLGVIGLNEWIRRQSLKQLNECETRSTEIVEKWRNRSDLLTYQLKEGISTEQVLASRTREEWERENKETLGVMTKLKEGLNDAIDQIQQGFRRTGIMYTIVFAVGIGLLVISVPYGIITGQSLLTAIFGAIGILDVLVFLIVKPPRDLERSRANLAQLQAGFYHWFYDMYNWKTFLGDMYRSISVDEMDESKVNRIKNVVTETSRKQQASTTHMMENIYKYCELTSANVVPNGVRLEALSESLDKTQSALDDVKKHLQGSEGEKHEALSESLDKIQNALDDTKKQLISVYLKTAQLLGKEKRL
jgi:hypothetical protein